jgi:putative nucleotidyltransferase with HDIG domain
MSDEALKPDIDPTKLDYFRVPVSLYKNGDRVSEDVYLLYQGQYVLYRSKNNRWTLDDTRKLTEFGSTELYIRCADEKAHVAFLEQNLGRILRESNTPKKEKASILYQCASGIAQDIFTSPRSTETFVRSKAVVDHTFELLSKDNDAFLQMISLSSHDYYTYTHCVNVMTFTISLLNALGVRDQKIIKEAAIGAFLHDIGKSKIPLTILNKPGPLLEEEWQIMRQHPAFGIELLDDKPVPDRSRQVILQHHEKINGIGYPYGLKGDRVQLVSQVVSVCDAYDAMTTNRCYQKALQPFQAFEIITQQMKGHFDPKIVSTFIQLLNTDKKK